MVPNATQMTAGSFCREFQGPRVRTKNAPAGNWVS